MPDLDYIFYPNSIAIVGLSRSPGSYVNHFYLNPLIRFGYKGDIYPIHPTASELAGLKAYPSVLDVPGPIDHVICAIKATSTPGLMKECVAKGVKTIHFFTSGFSESGEKEGIRLEKEITEIAHQGNIRVLGPNCMGLYCPGSGISYEPSFPRESGNVAFLCQSGGNSIQLVHIAGGRGIHFSKVVSYGNASDLNESDFLEYFTHDPQTKIIVGYVEGTRQGKRFISALRKAAMVKPVIMVKGGVTKAGTKAVASHTGALAGSSAIWESLFRQAGIIQVCDLEEIVDLTLLFQHLQPSKGRRIGIVGIGGGSSVLATDSCERERLNIAEFAPELIEKLKEIVPTEVDPGTSVRNPADISAQGWNPDTFSKALETIANHNGIDFIITHVNVPLGPSADELINQHIDSLIKTKQRLTKPIATVALRSDIPEAINNAIGIQEKCARAGIPVFSSFDRAARAISRFIGYYEAR